MLSKQSLSPSPVRDGMRSGSVRTSRMQRAISSGESCPPRQTAPSLGRAVAPPLARNKNVARRDRRCFVPIRSAARPSPLLRNQFLHLPLIRVPIFAIPHQRLLTSLLPHSSLLLPSTSRPSDCRPSFTGNHKAQPLLQHHSLLFTSLAGVTLFKFSFYTIRLFNATTYFHYNHTIDLYAS
jgi:hypothetical protein